jgi:hypothetical protein
MTGSAENLMSASTAPDHRARRALAAALTVLVAVLVASPGAAVAASSGSLPRRIGAPTRWTASALRSPVGAASVVYSGGAWSSDDIPDAEVGLVGAESDVYRVLPTDSGPSGMGTVLSGDGKTLAVEGALVDLASGRRRVFRRS